MIDHDLFGLESGRVSGVAASSLGYDLYRCDAVRPVRRLEFSLWAACICRQFEDVRWRHILRYAAAPRPRGA